MVESVRFQSPPRHRLSPGAPTPFKQLNKQYNMIPRERPLPPPTPPIVVPESKHSSKPTNDREVLLRSVQTVANKLHESLARDSLKNHRYVRRLRLRNRGRKGREDYEIKLPLAATCWNEMDLEMLEILIMKTIIDQTPDDHVWHNIEARFDQFMSHVAKECMDNIDEISNEQVVVLLDDLAREEASRSAGPQSRPSVRSSSAMRESIVKGYEDEDEDIQIVFDSSRR